MCDVKNSGIVFNTSNILNKTTTDLNEQRKKKSQQGRSFIFSQHFCFLIWILDMFKGENVLAQYIQINLLTVQFPFYLILNLN